MGHSAHQVDPLFGSRPIDRPIVQLLLDSYLSEQPHLFVHPTHLPALLVDGGGRFHPLRELEGALEELTDAHSEPTGVADGRAGELELDVDEVVAVPRRLDGVVVRVEDEEASHGGPCSVVLGGPPHGAVLQVVCKVDRSEDRG